MFLHLCHSVHSGGGDVCPSACWDTRPSRHDLPLPGQTPPPLGRHHPPGQTPPPPGQTPPLPSVCWDTHTPAPAKCMLGYTSPCPVHAGIDMATAADGTHPTGMHSCRTCSLKEAPNYKVFDARQLFKY